jgi:hypothetical protein
MVQKNMRLVCDGGTGTILGRYPKIPLDGRYSQESVTLVLLITGSPSEVLRVVLSALTISQVWLFPLVDGCHCGYITKLEKKKKKPPGDSLFLFWLYI